MLRVFRHYLPAGLLWAALIEGLLLLLVLPVGTLLSWILNAGTQDPGSRLVVAPTVVLAYALSRYRWR